MEDGDAATILVVDDEADVREAFRLYLESADHEVRTAANGGEAVVELDPEIDIILLDRRMPGMSGDEVLGHIEDWHADCRVAMVTAVDPGPDILDLAFDDYITKPVSKDDLLSVINRFERFDRYNELANEYRAVARKYAVLKGHENGSQDDLPELEKLEARQATLLQRINDIVDEFDNEEVKEVFRVSAPVND
jgi:CheY-like chemotaxis protein